MKKRTWKTNLFIALMLLPALTVALGIIAYPMLNTVWRSFQKADGSGFTLEHYRFLFTDRVALANIWYTFWITVVTVLLAIVIAYLFAMYLRFSNSRVRKIISTLYLLPRFVPELVAIYAMMTVVRDSGFLNRISQLFGGNFKPGLLFNANGIIMMNLWFNIAFATMIIVAALSSIPDSIIESAAEAVIQRIGREHILGTNDDDAARVIGNLLRERGWTLAVAESCTGGLLARRITAISGASDYFDRGFITYSNQAKVDLLQVPAPLIEAHGAVSEPVARAMTEGALRQARSQAALAITGIAGPTGGAPEKPVGTVFIGCGVEGRVTVERYQLSGDREMIQERSAHAALIQLWRALSRD